MFFLLIPDEYFHYQQDAEVVASTNDRLAENVEYWLWGEYSLAHPEPLQIGDKHLTTRRTSAWILARYSDKLDRHPSLNRRDSRRDGIRYDPSTYQN